MLNNFASYLLSNPLGCINAVVCLGVSFHGVCVINKMTRHTSIICWLGYALMTCGAFAVAVAPLYGGWTTDPSEALMNSGLLVVILFRVYSNRCKTCKGIK